MRAKQVIVVWQYSLLLFKSFLCLYRLFVSSHTTKWIRKLFVIKKEIWWIHLILYDWGDALKCLNSSMHQITDWAILQTKFSIWRGIYTSIFATVMSMLFAPDANNIDPVSSACPLIIITILDMYSLQSRCLSVEWAQSARTCMEKNALCADPNGQAPVVQAVICILQLPQCIHNFDLKKQ